MIIEPGASRQFDVLVDDKVIATRNKGWLKRMFGGGWPDVDEVAAKLGTN